MSDLSPTSPPRRAPAAEERATFWLAVGIVALPVLQLLAWDFDRSAPLAVLTPALWAGREAAVRGCARLLRSGPAWQLLMAGLVVIVILAISLSTHRAASIVAVAGWAALGVGAMLAGQLVAEAPARGRFLLGAVGVSVVVGVLAHWVQWKLGAPPESAFYLHHRLMGLHALGGAFATTALLVGARNLASPWLLAGIVAWGGLWWTGSRAPLIGLAAALALWWWRGDRATRFRLVMAVAGTAGGGLLLSAAVPADRPHLGWGRVWSSAAEATSAQAFTSNRSDFWRGAARHVAEAPWLGRGPDAYRFLEPKLEGAQPHNALLQWALDFGVPGATLVLALVLLVLARGVRRQPPDGPNAGWVGLTLATLVAGQLDGFFYHLLGLVPAALAFGVCAGTPFGAGWSAPQYCVERSARLLSRIIAVAATSVVLLHTWIAYRVSFAPPPPPNGWVARVWRVFPSMTQNLERWIRAWEQLSPDVALDLARRAQRESPFGDFFHVQAAGILLRRGDREGALRELAIARSIAAESIRPVIEQLQRQVEDPPARP